MIYSIYQIFNKTNEIFKINFGGTIKVHATYQTTFWWAKIDITVNTYIVFNFKTFNVIIWSNKIIFGVNMMEFYLQYLHSLCFLSL